MREASEHQSFVVSDGERRSAAGGLFAERVDVHVARGARLRKVSGDFADLPSTKCNMTRTDAIARRDMVPLFTVLSRF